jgi:peptidoglycan/LPS O-acetylase OafA/YrhL
MVTVLGAGRRWFRRDSPVLRYGRQVGFALYVVHQPVIVAVAFVVVQWHLPIAAKFVTVFVASGIATLVLAEVLTSRHLAAAGHLAPLPTLPQIAPHQSG